MPRSQCDSYGSGMTNTLETFQSHSDSGTVTSVVETTPETTTRETTTTGTTLTESTLTESTAAPAIDVDQIAVETFAGRVIADFAGAASTAMTVIGDRLGLFEAMTGAGPLSASELADRTRLNPRLVTEWLAA